MSLNRTLLLVPPIIVGVALVFFAAANRPAPEEAARVEQAHPARVIEAQPREFVPRVHGFGSVEPARTWEAVAEVAGRVAWVNPSFVDGGTVRAGEVLVRIARDEYELALAQARANRESAGAEAEQIRLTEATTRSSLAIERESLVLAERELERQRALSRQGTVSTSAVDNQTQAVLAQRARVQTLDNEVTLLPARREVLAQGIAVASANLAIAELELERTVIAAPFDARVASAGVEFSQYVAPGARMGSLDGIDAAEIVAWIPPRQMASFARLSFGERGPRRDQPGSRRSGDVPAGAGLSAAVTVEFAEIGTSWAAEVIRVSEAVDPETRSIGVVVRVSDPYGQARPGVRPPLIKGMFTRVEVRAPPVAGVFVLPRAAIRGEHAMTVGEGDRLVFTAVSVLHTYEDVAVLGDGLSPGTRVVVDDLSPAIEGALLDPRLDEALAARLAAAAGTAEATR